MTLEPGTYQRVPCFNCKGEPMQWSHEMLTDKVVSRVTFCAVCGGTGLALMRVSVVDQREKS